ncbi:MAG TPA: transposase [Candidatus Angelobacter sp.]|nr:transposase [Candidatus Angelobacter sp.]
MPLLLGTGQYIHKIVDHAERYVDGQVHTNGLENFWSLFETWTQGHIH